MDKHLWHWEIVWGCEKEIVRFGITIAGRLNVNRRLFSSLPLSRWEGSCQRPCKENCVCLTLLGKVVCLCVYSPREAVTVTV